jgi:hypothetical protein
VVAAGGWRLAAGGWRPGARRVRGGVNSAMLCAMREVRRAKKEEVPYTTTISTTHNKTEEQRTSYTAVLLSV